jgi:hypothetical protein
MRTERDSELRNLAEQYRVRRQSVTEAFELRSMPATTAR